MARRTVCGLSRACAWKPTMQSSRVLWWFIGSCSLAFHASRADARADARACNFVMDVVYRCMQLLPYTGWLPFVVSGDFAHSGQPCLCDRHCVTPSSLRLRYQWIGTTGRREHDRGLGSTSGRSESLAGNRGMPRWRVGDRGAGAHGVAGCHLALSGGETFGGLGPTGRRGTPWKRI